MTRTAVQEAPAGLRTAIANGSYVLFMQLAMWGMHELLISEHVRTDSTKREALIGSGLSLRLFLGVMIIGVAALLTLVLALETLGLLTHHSLFVATGASFALISLLLLATLQRIVDALHWRDLLVAPVLSCGALALVACAQ